MFLATPNCGIMYTYTNTKLHSQQIYELIGNYNVSQEVKLVVYVLDLNATRIVLLFTHRYY